MFAAGVPNEPFVYRRRQPEKTVLYQAVSEHWPKFVAMSEQADRPVPLYVRRELEGFLDCGLLERGAVRLRCPACGFDRLIAFSCKGRLCPSCAARRMAETAANLVDDLLPDVPLRQWVQTVPVPLRSILAYDSALLSQVIGVIVKAIFAQLVVAAPRELTVPAGTRFECGALCVPQRFNSALALSPHVHLLVADGVWAIEPGATKPTFRPLPPPTKLEIAAVSWAVCERTIALLRKQGRWVDDADEAGVDRLAHRDPLLASLAQASIAGTLVFGVNAGKRAVRFFLCGSEGDP